MRFAVVTSLISAALITVVSTISVIVLSWIFSTMPSSESTLPDSKAEISWGQGS
jgi:hypothetical protein